MYKFQKVIFVLWLVLGLIAQSHADSKGRSNITDVFSPTMGAKLNKLQLEIEDTEVISPPKKTSKPIESTKKKPMRKAVYTDDWEQAYKLGPDEEVPLRVERDANPAFVNMVRAGESGDLDLARKYAGQFARYIIKFQFDVRKYSRMIGEAYVENGMWKEENFIGVEQLLDWHFAKAQASNPGSFQITHEHQLQQIESPDPEGKAELYFFFSVNCPHCGEMANDLERMWRVAARDKNIRMAGAVLGNPDSRWLDTWKSHHKINFPLYDGNDMARSLRIRMLPAVVIVSPGNKKSYIRTGLQTFKQMFEFTRRVQGKPAKITPQIQKYVATPVNSRNLARKATKKIVIEKF